MDKSARRQEFGAKFKAAREAQGMNIAGLSKVTRITHAFLEAIEAGDFAKLPGEVFGRGFVRAIARVTHLDPVECVKEFADLWEREPAKSVLKVEIKNKPTINRGEGFRATVFLANSVLRRGAATKVVIPLVIVAGVAVAAARSSTVRTFVKSRMFDGGAASIQVPAKTIILPTAPEVVQPTEGKSDEAGMGTADAVSAAVDAAAAPAATIEGTKAPGELASLATDQILELVVTEPVRVRLDVDGGEALTKELAPDTYRFTFKDKADVMVYDAAAVKISFNGKSLGSLGTKGRIRKLSFSAGSASQNEM